MLYVSIRNMLTDASEGRYGLMEVLPRELFKVIIFSSKTNFSILCRLRDVSSWLAKLIVVSADMLAEFFAEQKISTKGGLDELSDELFSYELPNGIKHGLCFERNYGTIIIETETPYVMGKRHGWMIEKNISDQVYQTNCLFYVNDVSMGPAILYLHNIKSVSVILSSIQPNIYVLQIDILYDDDNQIIRVTSDCDYNGLELKFTNFPKNIDHDTLREWLFATLADPVNVELNAKF